MRPFGGFINYSDNSLISFVLSLSAHILLLVVLLFFQSQSPVSERDEPLEIVFREPKEAPMLVQAPPTQKPETKKPKKEVQFKSSQTNRVDLETWKRPERNAELQANISSGGQGGKAKKKQEAKPKSEMGDLTINEDRKPLLLPGYGGSQARPTIPAYVQNQLPPGVRLGNITALNTDQHRFYSFNQRLLQRFVPLWGSQVRKALYQWLKDNNAPAISKTWVTNVEIILDEKGEILEVQPFRLSGLWSIDQAAINSFKTVKNVPNPPQEMIDENGYIHLQFQTEVYWIPQPGVRFHGGN